MNRQKNVRREKQSIPDSELGLNDGSVWYLPHHHVTSEAKPGKIRVVFDCAAKFRDVSLNNQCLQGPDLVNKLIHVLLRFRQFSYAVMADIEAMYLQVCIPPVDRNALRFLWLDHDRISEYRMTSHPFGGVWCASSSTHALRQTVLNLPDHDLVKETVLNAFYVDDMLKSVKSLDEARQIITGTKRAIESGGFKLTKFVSNDRQLLNEIDSCNRATEVKEITPEMYSRALGIRWDVYTDAFLYVHKHDNESHEITRRFILSRIGAMYDPLGLISLIVLKGRAIFQDATRQQLQWDDSVPDDIQTQWYSWQESLKQLEFMSFPRCIIPTGFENGMMELHHFCDASSTGYGACSYLRVTNPDGRIHVSLVASKACLAPIRTVTIPRLELAAAVVAVRLDALLRSAFEIECIVSTFWSDSQIVLSYLSNESRRYKVFVANRVSVIQQFSAPDQWRYINTNDNLADMLSRGCDATELPNLWFEGPDFLSQFKCDWPQDRCENWGLNENDPELKTAPVDQSTDDGMATAVHATVKAPHVHAVDALLAHYSSVYKVKKAISWLRRFFDFMKTKHAKRGNLSVSELNNAEHAILTHVQHECYRDEIAQIENQGVVSTRSHLAKLCPRYDNGLLVVGGRLRHACVPDQTKCPAILPKHHRVSKLICQEYHDVCHVGTEWVLGQIQRKFWIVKARSVLKKIRRDCVLCKKLYSKPCVQQMADLPPERVVPGQPPFHCVGIDVFGPFHVTQGRSTVKRYGVVYSCFSTRAVHIEMLPSLETDTFINGFMRFISRRGMPSKVWSDNGTNIVGARTELSRSLRQLDRSKIVSTARRKDVEWSFNPPHASHQGGLWERMIRTIRHILVALLTPNARISDDVLNTIMCEIENLINSRPLTKCSDDVDDDAPLTPNHISLLKGNSSYPWCTTQVADTYRRRWNHVQHVVEQFWRRWIREYLPELNRHQKWLNPLPNVKPGDLVLISDECTPRGAWPLGLITETKIGRDGLVLSAKVRTKSTHLVRPITKLILLESVHYQSEE